MVLELVKLLLIPERLLEDGALLLQGKSCLILPQWNFKKYQPNTRL
jgi:hypothetical protein